MPSYEYRCRECGGVRIAFRTVDMRHAPLRCDCGGEAYKLISRANFAMHHWAYDGPVGLSDLDRLSSYKEETRQYEQQNFNNNKFGDTSMSMDTALDVAAGVA